MSPVQQTIRTALVAIMVVAAGVLFESVFITDPDLRSPIVLLTKIFGAIVLIVSIARVAVIFIQEKVRASAPHALEGLRNLGGVLFVTIVSLGACVFGMSLVRAKSGSIGYWPVGIVLIFGMLAAYCIRSLWRGWQMYRRFSRRSGASRSLG